MAWLAVPSVLILGSLVALAAIASLESARRDLQDRVAALVEVRATLGPVQARIEAARAAAAATSRR